MPPIMFMENSPAILVATLRFLNSVTAIRATLAAFVPWLLYHIVLKDLGLVCAARDMLW